MNQVLIHKVKSQLMEVFASPCDQTLLIVIGANDSLFIQGLKQNIQNYQSIIVIDFPNDLEKFQSSQIHYCSALDLNSIQCLSKQILYSSKELRFRIIDLNDQRTQLIETLKSNVGALIKELTGLRYRTELQFHNFFMNIPSLCTGNGIQAIKNIAKGKTAVVVGAGPSLKSQVHWLIDNREKLFIIAAGSVASGLYKNDIHPDLYVETDHRAPTHWEDIDPSQYNLVAASTITAGLANKFKQVFWAEAACEHRDWFFELEKNFCPDLDRLKSPDQNTGLTAAGVAEYCGVNKIILIGIDLCLSPDGDSHSDLFHRGKDTLKEQNDKPVVLNNRGEKCSTIYGAFIQGFESLINMCPNTEFIQTSENGVCLKGAHFLTTDQIELNVEKPEVPEIIKEFSFRSLRPHLRQVKKEISDLNKGETEFQRNLVEIIKINSFFFDLSSEFSRQQNKYLSYLNSFQSILHEFEDCKNLYEDLPPETCEVGVTIDWQKEYELAGIEPNYTPEKSNSWKLDWQRTHMMQLLIMKDGMWSSSIGQYELMDNAKALVSESLSENKNGLKHIICLGIFDGNYLMLLASKLKGFSFTIVEPDIDLLATMLRYVPLASQLPADTKWLRSVDVIKDLDRSLIICPDKKGEHLTYLKEMYEKLESRCL